MSAAREEAVKKGLQDQILVMACLSTVAAAPTDVLSWELAYAYCAPRSCLSNRPLFAARPGMSARRATRRGGRRFERRPLGPR